MEDAIPQADLKKFYPYFLEETFAAHRGIYLEEGSSLLETLDGITAEQASIRVGRKCGSLAAQVAHVTFYMETTEKAMLTREEQQADYQNIWRTVEKVNNEEWQHLKDNLKAAYERIRQALCTFK